MTRQASLIDDAWNSAVGGFDWLKSVLFGEFADNRPLSAIVADMLLSFVPGFVIVTSARDAVAVILRLAAHPEKREELMEWILLCACLITLALPLALAAGGAVAAGVGAVVGGIAGSELGAAIRAVMLLLIKEASKLGDVLRFLQKFVKGDIVKFLRALQFARYERAITMALNKTVGKLIEVCQSTRSHLDKLSYFDDAREAIRTLRDWEQRFYAVQQAALRQIPKALTELDKRKTALLAQTFPKEMHTVASAVEAARPAAPIVKVQRVRDTPGKIVKAVASDEPRSAGAIPGTKTGSGTPKVDATGRGASGGVAGGAGGGAGGRPPRKTGLIQSTKRRKVRITNDKRHLMETSRAFMLKRLRQRKKSISLPMRSHPGMEDV